MNVQVPRHQAQESVDREDSFQKTVRQLKTELQAGIKAMEQDSRDPDEWLRTLYSAYAERLRMDNERIWVTGAILLPLAITGFAAFVAINKPLLWHAVVLGLASSALAWFWLFIAENHRSFQRKSEAWLVAIQEVIGIKDTLSHKVTENRLNRLLTFRGAVQWTRWILVCTITVGWAVLAVLCALGLLTTAPN